MFGTSSVCFDPEIDIPDLTGRVVMVTGANAGLGKRTVLELAKHNPRRIVMTARDRRKGEVAIAEIQRCLSESNKPSGGRDKKSVSSPSLDLLEIDLTSFQSIKSAADTFLGKSSADSSKTRLDLLYLNAGIMAHDPARTEEGYEIQFGTNHVGHALLAKLLLPTLIETTKVQPDVRVIVVSSGAHRLVPTGGLLFDSLCTDARKLNTMYRYGQSKLANILWAKELAKKYQGVLTVVSLHPGPVKTSIGFTATENKPLLRLLVHFYYSLPMASVSVEEGAKCQLWAGTAKDVVSGEYYEPVGLKGKGSSWTKDADLAKRLWDWTERQLEVHVG